MGVDPWDWQITQPAVNAAIVTAIAVAALTRPLPAARNRLITPPNTLPNRSDLEYNTSSQQLALKVAKSTPLAPDLVTTLLHLLELPHTETSRESSCGDLCPDIEPGNED